MLSVSVFTCHSPGGRSTHLKAIYTFPLPRHLHSSPGHLPHLIPLTPMETTPVTVFPLTCTELVNTPWTHLTPFIWFIFMLHYLYLSLFPPSRVFILLFLVNITLISSFCFSSPMYIYLLLIILYLAHEYFNFASHHLYSLIHFLLYFVNITVIT